MKSEALRLLRTNSSRTTFEENIYKFKSRLLARGYPKRLIETLLSDVKFTERESALQKKNENRKELLPFVTCSILTTHEPRGTLYPECLRNKVVVESRHESRCTPLEDITFGDEDWTNPTKTTRARF